MKIAVTDTGKPEKQKLYMDWLQSFDPDAQLVVASYRNDFKAMSGYDGLVITGGEDVDPRLSKATPVELVESIDRKRDDFEFMMLKNAIEKKIPILGICRGLQVANVFFGGTLVADLPESGYERHTAKKNEPELYHEISVNEGSLMQSVVKVSGGKVNSYHHQSVRVIADDLTASGYSGDDVIEAMEWKEKEGKQFLMLVQWHPERMADKTNPFTTNIGSAFLAETKKYYSTK